MKLLDEIKARLTKAAAGSEPLTSTQIAESHDAVVDALEAAESELPRLENVLTELVLSASEKDVRSAEDRIDALRREIQRLRAASTRLQELYEDATNRESAAEMEVKAKEAAALAQRLAELKANLATGLESVRTLNAEGVRLAHELWAVNKSLSEHGRQDLEAHVGGVPAFQVIAQSLNNIRL